jgi:hypothetical protein
MDLRDRMTWRNHGGGRRELRLQEELMTRAHQRLDEK